MSDTCEWKYDNDGYWHTECSNAYFFELGGPADNHYRFCPYCGMEIVVSEGDTE